MHLFNVIFVKKSSVRYCIDDRVQGNNYNKYKPV